MSQDERVVCIAINDNNRAWYEMVVPFLLSLRQTDYDGQVAVISYGLSDQKKEILTRQAITVIEASTAYALPVGRFIEAADYCAKHPNIRKLALYDADIWFCASQFDLFSHIVSDKIYACPDPLFCSFIVSPLIGVRRDENWRLAVDEVKARHGAALQAGLVAGTAEAWMRFGQHLRRCMAQVGTDFVECFGIDTTFLHLWAARGEVAQLDPTQNFIVKSGLQESFNEYGGTTTLNHMGNPVRALHMTGDIRFFDRWRYYINNVDIALREGAKFALSGVALDDVDPLDAAPNALRSVGLALATCSVERCSGSHLQVVGEPSGAMLVACGNHEIVLEAVRDVPGLQVYATHPSGSPSPLRCEVEIGGNKFYKQKDLATHFKFHMRAGERILLRSKSLGGQLCDAIWRLRETAEMKQ